MSGDEFPSMVDGTYNEITKLRKSLFKIPSGKGGKQFVTELLLDLNATIYEQICRGSPSKFI